MYKQSIGIVGGFGAYATLNFYSVILEKFATSCERNYPHIYMDNDFTMPSRTRALYYGDDFDKVIDGISVSVEKLCSIGADIILFPCGTAHAFIPSVIERVPKAKDKIINMLTVTNNYIENNIVKNQKILIIAAEGMLKHKIWSRYCCYKDYIEPDECYFEKIRFFIEAVKQNKLSVDVCEQFIKFVDSFDCHNIILGCTEFPLLIKYMKNNGFGQWVDERQFIDPIDIIINYVKDHLH